MLTNTCPIEKKGDLRVMFYNIYGYDNDENYGGKRGGPIALRHAEQIEIFESYDADVMGFQEYVTTSHNILTPKIAELGYLEVPSTRPEGDKVNDTPIFYKESRLTLKSSGYHLFHERVEGVPVSCNNAFTKSLSWAVFEKKTDGKQFAFISTHLMYTADISSREAAMQYHIARSANVVELFGILDEIQKEYPNIPVIVGGDLNSYPGSDAFTKLQTRLTWMQEASGVNADTLGFKGYSTYSYETKEYTVCPNPPATGYGIDHAFYCGALDVINYLTLTDRASLLASDHCPKLADIALH